MQPIIIIGCQRSGTTILYETLQRHPDIAGWLEPFFIWDMKLALKETDDRDAEEATDAVKSYIHQEFNLFYKKSGKKFLIEKSPENCFRIPFVLSVFPEAKFINITRDGRDSVLSIYQQWIKREQQVKSKSFTSMCKEIYIAMQEQPFWRNRFQEIWFELSNINWLSLKNFLNKSRWKGYHGWGPRYSGWEKDITTLSVKEFNAKQWVESVKKVEEDRHLIPSENIIDIKYEDFLDHPQEELTRLLSFIGADIKHLDNMSRGIMSHNKNKWQKALSHDEITAITNIQSTMLSKLGYEIQE